MSLKILRSLRMMIDLKKLLVFDKNRPDMLAVAAIDGDKIMGMAGASADNKTMWQIGIDVLPKYRGQSFIL